MSAWIPVRATTRGLWRVDGPVPDGTLCYVDGGLVGQDGWGRCHADGEGADTRAAAEWAATAVAAAETAVYALGSVPVDIGNGRIAVLGAGALGGLIRMALGRAPLHAVGDGGAPVEALGGGWSGAPDPAVIIEATGSSVGLGHAIGRVARSGLVVLAARPVDPPPAVRTYGDVHRRGLTVTATAWVSDPHLVDACLAAWASAQLVGDSSGSKAARPETWYRLACSGRRP